MSFIFFSFSPIQAMAQDANAIDGWIANAASVKLKDVKNAVKEFERTIEGLDAEYVKSFDDGRSLLSDRLDAARSEATKADRLDDAIQIRNLQKSLGEVTASPKEKSEKPKASSKPNDMLSKVVGSWEGNWGRSNAKCLLAIDKNGNVMNENEHLQLGIQNGRLLALGAAKHQNLEIIPNGDRIIVLGWTASKGRQPLVDQPDAVSILNRIRQAKR